MEKVLTRDDLMAMIEEFVQRWEAAEIAWYTKMNEEYQVWQAAEAEWRAANPPRYGMGLKHGYAQGDSPNDHYNKFFLDRGVKDGSTRYDIQVWHQSEDTRNRVAKRLRKEVLQTRIEALRKKIENKAGEITEVRNLRWNPNGGFDGVVTGTKKTVVVETITAGGYNIQRLHYRTLVK